MSNRPDLTDDAITQFLRTRSADPELGLLDEIVRTVGATSQDRPWPGLRPILLPRRTLLIAAIALLLATMGAMAVGSRLLQPDLPTETEAVFDVALHYYGVPGNVIRVPEPTRIRARLPDGWVANEIGMTMASGEAEDSLAISFWAVDAVFTEPCTNESRADPPMTRTLDSLADAFTDWWASSEMWAGRPPSDLPRTIEPVRTTVSGFRAQYLEVRVPDDVDTDACFGGRYATWRNADGVERHHRPGDVSRLWIVEVGPPPRLDPAPSGFVGGPSEATTPLLVIDATSQGEPSPEDLAGLVDIIDSMRIEAPAEEGR
jgi:hypothetical protein